MQTSAAASPTPRVEIRPRRMEFAFDDSIPRHWCGDAPETHFWNALSVLFPKGETFFVDSVRNYRDQITDDVLRREIVGFSAQEATHSRQHEAYNAWLSRLGYSAETMDRFTGWLLDGVRMLPPDLNLAATCALEHMTSILAELVLTDEALRERMAPAMFEIWAWHALEENEHKAVAFDVYREVSDDYGYRMLAYFIATALLAAVHAGNYHSMMKTDGLHRDPKTWIRSARVLFGRSGYVTRLAPKWLDYVARDFHPWDHDNRALIETWKRKLPSLRRAAV